jgi:ABC-type phosphate transport system substrate-binding protein
MTSLRWFRTTSTALLFAVGAAVHPAGMPAQAASRAVVAPHEAIVVIVNTENAVQQVSMGELRRILLGEMTHWPNGHAITIAMRPPGLPERSAILRLICGMDDSDFARYELESTYRGETPSAVKQLDTPTGVKRFVFNVPGAIGFIRADEVDATVKLPKITGAVPTAPAFGLTLRAQ